MSDRVRRADLGITRLLWLFAVLSMLLLAALAAAPVRDHFTEWRAAQKRYNRAAAQVGAPPVEIGLKQIWRPELERVDRCTSCHLGMGVATPDPHEPLFAAHPPMPHEPRDMGCTVCHGGQGRATSADDAHGDVEFWDEPMLAAPFYQAGCGRCHSGVPVPGDLAAAQAAFERSACLDCHRVDGRGRGEGPDLSTVGGKGFAAGWHAAHVARPGFAPLPERDRALVDAFLKSRIGAPRLVAGKALSLELGCRGCHRIGGVGGEEGPDLGNEGGKVARELDYTGVSGPRTLAGWLHDHFLDPAKVVPTSLMPDLGMTDAQAELLTLYMLSLRSQPLPESQTPRDRLRAGPLGERDFGSDGGALFAAFCAGCHGPAGAGRRLGIGDQSYPAIGSAAFLALADDDLLRATVTSGRPGRKMPAWGTKDGGLTRDEVDRVVAYLRSLEPAAPSFEAVMASPVDLAGGERLYRADCATCHGDRGEGSALGPSVPPASERALYEVLVARRPGMGSYAAYPAASLRALIAFVPTLGAPAAPRPWKAAPGDATRGAARFAATCAGCHGQDGRGGAGPALGNPAFLAAARDSYLAATILRGRGDTAMPRFDRPGPGHPALDAGEVADLVAFIRSLAAPAAPPETRSSR
ncbi:MAG TPA: c-type cytochrome [Kofleriaceae bacterium]|nr:c-type cytochrome [Kofleriaceae bacterium]